MSTIHQIYCTHCTHGSSALERREGELAHRMLGYSARAGSLEARHLRRYYRQIERYVSYYLPRDTPSEEKLRLGASSAPRRLVYHPSAGGLQVVGQVCYRQTDTEGRPGSYFAHVLFREENDGQPRWSPLDCLKLWGAPGWAQEDSPHIPFLLEPLGSLSQMLGGQRPAIDDQVLLSFLATPAGGSFDDPAGAIPERWRRIDAPQRSSLFLDAFRGFLQISGQRRESLLLVIEPSVAALVFYGILRLLPNGGAGGAVSFSTFEPNTDRVGTSLAATLFYDPQKTDLRADAYRLRGFVINTFSGRRSENRLPQAQYARTMVRRLLEEGWGAVDWSLATFDAAGARRPEDLEALSAADNLLPALFDPRKPPPIDDWRRLPMAADYLRQALARQLGALDDVAASLEPIVGRPAHLTILELIAGGPELPGMRAAAEFLFERLPGEQIADLVKLDRISPEAKVDVLVRYVTSHAQLPPGCEHLWAEEKGRGVRGEGPGDREQATGHKGLGTGDREQGRAQRGEGRERKGPTDELRLAPHSSSLSPVPYPLSPFPPHPSSLLTQVLARLDGSMLETLYGRVAPQHSDAFLMSLLAASKHQPSARAGLGAIVRAMDDEALLSLFCAHGPAFFKEYPDDEPSLSARLHQVVGSLVEHVRQFPERLDFVLAGRHLLPDEDQNVVTGWANVRDAILDVHRLQAERSGILRRRPIDELETACRRMAEAAARAMPRKRFDDDARGTQKQNCLRKIGQRLSGGRPFLPPGVWQHDALWQKMSWYFQNGSWPSAPLGKMCERSWSPGAKWTLLGTIVAAVLVVVAIGALRWPSGVKSDRAETAEPPDQPRPAATQAAPRRDSPQPTARDHQPAREVVAEETTAEQTEAQPVREDDPWETEEPVARQSEQGATPQPDEEPDAVRGSPDPARVGEVGSPAPSGGEQPSPPAAKPQAVVSRPTQDPAIENAPLEAETGKSQAERFAREHGGKFFDEQPLADGELQIPADALPVATGRGALFLGGGVLYFDHAFYPFGAGFEARPPVSRHEVPQLANALGVPSVYVELQARPSGSAVVLGLVPDAMPPDAEAKKDAAIDGVEKTVRMIVVQLRAYNSQTATKEQKDEAFENLVKLTGIEIPPVPPQPNRRDEKYRERPEAYEAALKAYHEAVAVHNRAVDGVIPAAKRAVASVDEKKEYIETQIRAYEKQMRENNEQGLAALRQQCRRMTVIVYRAVAGEKGQGTSDEAPDASDDHAVRGSPDPARVGEVGSPAPSGASNTQPSVDGRFRVEERPAQGLQPPAIAQLRPVVTGEGGRPLPPWFRQEIVTGCRVVEQNEDGFLLRTIEMRDIDVERTADVFEKTTALRVRFEFFPRPDKPFDRPPQEKAIAAVSHLVEPIEQGKQYTIQLELTGEGLDWLRLLNRDQGRGVRDER